MLASIILLAVGTFVAIAFDIYIRGLMNKYVENNIHVSYEYDSQEFIQGKAAPRWLVKVRNLALAAIDIALLMIAYNIGIAATIAA